MLNKENNFENAESLATLEQLALVIGMITKNDLRQNIKWLSHLRIAKGYLQDAIRELNIMLSKREA